MGQINSMDWLSVQGTFLALIVNFVLNSQSQNFPMIVMGNMEEDF